MQHLAVVYEFGAASVGEIVGSLASQYELSFLVPSPDLVPPPLLRLMGRMGKVVIKSSQDWDYKHLRNQSFDGIVTYSEHCVLEAAQLGNQLGLRQLPISAARIVRDKLEQRRLLAAAGAIKPVPYLVYGTDLTDERVQAEIGFPLVLKPRGGAGSIGTYYVENIDRLHELADHVVDPLLEAYITSRPNLAAGDIVSVETFSWNGQRAHLPITGRFPGARPFREHGLLWPADVSSAETTELYQTVEAALDCFEITDGVTHTEFKLATSGLEFIEMNGRLGGQLGPLAKRAFNVDLILWAAQIATGEFGGFEVEWPDECIYQYHCLPPAGAKQVVDVTGSELVRQIPGVEEWSQWARAGEVLRPWPATHWLDVTKGRCHEHSELRPVTAAIEECLNWTFH